MWHFYLWSSRVQIQSNFSKSTQLFLLHLPPARVKTWTRLCLPQETRSGLQESLVSSYHMMSMQKMAHWSVQDLPRVLQQLLLHIMLKLIWQVKDCFQTKLCVFFLWLFIQISVPFHVRPVSFRLLLILVLQLLHAMLPSTIRNPFCQTGICAGKADYYSRQFIQHVYQNNIHLP